MNSQILRVINGFLKYSERLLKNSAYPDHPNSVVVSKKDSLINRELCELDIYSYYTNDVVKGMLKELKSRDLFIGIRLEGRHGKLLYIRHPYDKKTEYIRINSISDFQKYRSGRTIEYHCTTKQRTDFYIIDFDAGDEPFSQTKKITADISDALDKLPEVSNTTIRYTGKRGFHIISNLKKSIDVDSAREFLKGWLKDNFGDRDDVVIGESPSGKKGALGLSPMKVNGGQVALWSLRVTGLCCVEVPRANLMSFEKEDASLEKTYKKLTGKSFKVEKLSYRLPSVKSPTMPHTPLEKPTAYAVEVLVSEHPTSSGWHTGFSKDFNEIEPCWAIVFDGKLSAKARRSAESAGLKIKERTGSTHSPSHALTDVYLPDVGRTNYVRASKVFNSFADSYKGLTRKVASVINGYINVDAVNIKTAGYDREQLKPGYKGRFLLQTHSAIKAGKHLDLRIEFPVTDLHRALKGYEGKRSPETNEPFGPYKSKPGTVYRSWAVKKHTIPTKSTKLFIVETEDHPIDYGKKSKFTIPEGMYGAGDVEIWDRGSYELLDVEGDKKYVIDFKGNKLNGTFAIVKYLNGYLWVKTTKNRTMKKASDRVAEEKLKIEWKKPDFNSEIGEYFENEPTKKYLKRNGLSFENRDELIKFLNKGELREISKSTLQSHGKNITITDKDFEKEISEPEYSYGYQRMEKLLERHKVISLEAPILIKFGNVYYCLSGNRRSNLAFNNSIPAKFWIVEAPSIKLASAIDYTRPTMNQALWDLTSFPPKLKRAIRENTIKIIHRTFQKKGLIGSEEWVKGLYITGAMTGFNYKEDGDFDINISWDENILKEKNPELKKESSDKIHKCLYDAMITLMYTYVVGTKNNYSIGPLKQEDHPNADAIYDLIADQWISEPKRTDINFDPDVIFMPIRKKTEEICSKIDVIVGEIVRKGYDLFRINQYTEKYGQFKYKKIAMEYRIKRLCDELRALDDYIRDLMPTAISMWPKGAFPAYKFSPNWEEHAILLDYIARGGYLKPIEILQSRLKEHSFISSLINKFL